MLSMWLWYKTMERRSEFLPQLRCRYARTAEGGNMNHEELIERLRSEARVWCTNCCYKLGDFHCGAPEYRKKDCDVETKFEAADAIEELLTRLEGCEECKIAKEWWSFVHLLQPRWISVEERLPEREEEVLVLVKYKWSEQYFYGLDAYSQVDGGWEGHERVTYWMPLPQPLKEET